MKGGSKPNRAVHRMMLEFKTHFWNCH